MSTIRMNSGTAQTGNLQIPAPSLAIVAVVNGIGSVNAADVPTHCALDGALWLARTGPVHAWYT
jgi:hypothetical protein